MSAIDPRSGAAMMRDAVELYPICRSITGNGVRESLRLLQRRVPLQLNEVASGTKVFDWEVPREWNIREAWIKDPRGKIVADLRSHSIHVLNYSVPVRARLPLDRLREHLYSLPEHPDWIPYRTSYYRETWGFCLAHSVLDSLPDGEYEVFIDSSLEDGHLTYGELLIPGASQDEIVFSAHCCHPSLANDNLSGMVVAAQLAAAILQEEGRHDYSCRFLWLPGTIGSITWLALHQDLLSHIKAGLVLSCVGDSGPFTYKCSRQGTAAIDRAVSHVLTLDSPANRIIEFSPLGYDERQYCSPGINLPFGCVMRTPNGCYPEYHTSADSLDLLSETSLAGTLAALQRVRNILERDRYCTNLSPMCEPQLGRRGLYRAMGGLGNTGIEQALLWVLNLSDGRLSLLDIADRSGLNFDIIDRAAILLEQHGLLKSDWRRAGVRS